MQRTEFTSTLTNDDHETGLTCTIIGGPPGSGKTQRMLSEIANKPGRYLLAAPRTDLVDEHAARLGALTDARASGSKPAIHVIHSRRMASPSKGSVDRRVRDALAVVDGEHVVIAITHAALLELTGADLVGWHVRIDELPDAVVSSSLRLGASWQALAALYDLMPAEQTGWSRVVPRSDIGAIGLHQIIDDDAGPVDLQRLAHSRGRSVIVDIAAWADAGVGQRRVNMCAVWSLADLRGCASLHVAAAGFEGSVAEKALVRHDRTRVVIDAVKVPRTGQPRIQICWFTKHSGSTKWWESTAGSACLVSISRYFEQVAYDGYWTSNKDIENYFAGRFYGAQCSPRVAGTNSLRHHESCAIIYSAKATPDDGAVMAILGLGCAELQAAREEEDIYQFATRGAIRDRDYAGDYTIYVYDDGQAERLRDRLVAGGYTDVSLTPMTEAGIVNVDRPRSEGKHGWKLDPASAAEQRLRKKAQETERGRRRRAAEKARKIDAGTYRPVGRPPGSTARASRTDGGGGPPTS